LKFIYIPKVQKSLRRLDLEHVISQSMMAPCKHGTGLQVSVTTSKDPDARGRTPSTTWTKWQQVATAGDTPDDGLIEARKM